MTTQAAMVNENKENRHSSRIGAWLMHGSNGLLVAAVIAFILIYLHYWPQSFSSMDESSYINMAAMLRHGTVYPDVANVLVPNAFPVGSHVVSKYPLGMPAFLAFMSLFGWRVVMGANLFVHLLTFLVVIRLLRTLNIPAGYAILYLLHPTAVLYSRTIMADPLSGLLIALAFDQYLKKRPWSSGLLVGASIVVRTGNVVAIPVFLAAMLFENYQTTAIRERIVPAAKYLVATLPFLLVAAYYAQIIAAGQIAAHTGNFGLRYFSSMFPAYVLCLLLIYPGMLIGPALYRGRGWPIIMGLCYSFLMLYSFWYYRDQGQNWEATLIVEQRYFLAALPLWIIAYAALCKRIVSVWPEKVRTLVAVCGTLMLLCLSAGIIIFHSRYTSSLARVRTALLEVVPRGDTLVCNMQIAKLFYPGHNVHWIMVEDASQNGSIETKVKTELQKPGAKVYFASWTRTGRRDDQQQAAAVAALANDFLASPVKGLGMEALPPDVVISRAVPQSIRLKSKTASPTNSNGGHSL